MPKNLHLARNAVFKGGGHRSGVHLLATRVTRRGPFPATRSAPTPRVSITLIIDHRNGRRRRARALEGGTLPRYLRHLQGKKSMGGKSSRTAFCLERDRETGQKVPWHTFHSTSRPITFTNCTKSGRRNFDCNVYLHRFTSPRNAYSICASDVR